MCEVFVQRLNNDSTGAVDVSVEDAVDNQQKYPYMGKNEDNTVVLFFREGRGTVLISGDEPDVFFGYHSKKWDESFFTPLKAGTKVVFTAT